MKRIHLVGLMFSLSLTHSPAQADNLEDLGDIMQIALPASAIGSTFFMGDPNGDGMWDKEGTKQGATVLGASFATVYAGKYISHKRRPHTDSHNSWPSGHTMGAFSGAAIFYHRYGPKWGVPAYALAGLTAYSRVDSGKHFADDVIAGASIPMLYGALFGTHHSEWEPVSMVPRIYPQGGYGLSWIITPQTLAALQEPLARDEEYKWRYTFAFGPAFLEKNSVQAPNGSGTTFDLTNWNRDNNPTTTSDVTLDYFFNERHQMLFSFFPFESRDTTTATNTINFDDQAFTAGTGLTSSWLLYDTRLAYRYDFIPNPDSDWNFQFGGGVLYQNLCVTLESTTGPAQTSKVRNESIFPYLTTTLERRISSRLSLGGELSGFYFNKDRLIDALIYFGWNVTDQWMWSLGYKYRNTKMDHSEMANQAVYHIPHLAVSYRW